MFRKRYTLEQLKDKIRSMEYYLGPLVGYKSDPWPKDKQLRWCMEYLFVLKERYYRGLKKRKGVLGR